MNDYPYSSVKPYLAHAGRILDYRGGMVDYLLNSYEMVYSYNIPHAERYNQNLMILSSLDSVFVRSYSEVLLMDIDTEELNTILEELSLLSPRFIIFDKYEKLVHYEKYLDRINVEFRNDSFVGIFKPLT
jgi:hypothetical protein